MTQRRTEIFHAQGGLFTGLPFSESLNVREGLRNDTDPREVYLFQDEAQTALFKDSVRTAL